MKPRRKMTAKQYAFILILATAITAFGSQAGADVSDVAQLAMTVETLQKQIQELRATVYEQGEKIKVMERHEPVVRVGPSAVGEHIDTSEFDERLQEKIGTSDAWLKDLDFGGDFRLRWEPSDRTDGPGKANDRNRFRYRLRFGWEKAFRPDTKVGFGLASQAANTEAASTNTSLDDSFTTKPISIEKAYADYQPDWAARGPIEKVRMAGGKFENPFEEGSSAIVWDRDVRPEGFFERVELQVIDTEAFDVHLYGLAGQLILEEEAGSGDAELWAWQVGLKPAVDVGWVKPLALKSVFSYYNYSDFGNLTSDGGTNVTSGNPSAIVTNAAGGFSAEDFDIVEIYNEAEFTPFSERFPIKTFFDWATNVANGALSEAAGDLNHAWALGFKVGKAKTKGGMEFGYEYRYVDPNAVVGQFADSDFGFANKRGSVFSAKYNVTDDLELGLTGFFTNNITADSSASGVVAANRTDEETRLFFTDLVWKF